MRLQLIVCDMAGTTVYDGDAVNLSLQSALGVSGVRATRDDINEVMGIPKPIAIRALLERRPGGPHVVTEEEVSRIYRRFLAHMLDYYRTDPEVRETPGAAEALRRLKAAGVRIALDTGFSREIADAVIERLGWQRDGLLDATVTSDEVERGRPHPDLILRAMELTGISDASRVAKVGDTPSDLQEGKAAGCGWIIGVTQGSHTREQLAAHSHTHLIDSVAQLPALFIEEAAVGV